MSCFSKRCGANPALADLGCGCDFPGCGPAVSFRRSAPARHSKFRLHAPLERILGERCRGVEDPPVGIPSCIRWGEFVLARHNKIDVDGLRKMDRENMGEMIGEPKTQTLIAVPLISEINPRQE